MAVSSIDWYVKSLPLLNLNCIWSTRKQEWRIWECTECVNRHEIHSIHVHFHQFLSCSLQKNVHFLELTQSQRRCYICCLALSHPHIYIKAWWLEWSGNETRKLMFARFTRNYLTYLVQLSTIDMEVKTVHNNLTIRSDKVSYDSSAGCHISGQGYRK